MEKLNGNDLELRITKPGFPASSIVELRKLASDFVETTFEYVLCFDKDHPLSEDELLRLVAQHTSQFILINLKTRKVLRPRPSA